MRITRRVFTDLAIWMVVFGVVIGFIFPFFVLMLGVTREKAMTPAFFMACLGAGIVAGGINFWLAKAVVGGRLRLLARVGERMRLLAENMRTPHDSDAGDVIAQTIDDLTCGDMGCFVEEDSDDEIGESAKAFNLLANTLKQTVAAERIASSFVHMISQHLDIAVLSEQALSFLIPILNAEAGMMAVVKDDQLDMTACIHLTNCENVVQSSHLALALKTGEITKCTIPLELSVDHVVGHHKAPHVYIVPLINKGLPLGAVVLTSAKAFSDEDYRRLKMIKTALAMSLNNALTHGRLRLLATLDPLTGIYNRSFGMNRLREEFKRVLRSESPLGVLMFDIDHFKSVNDSFGHLVGDRVIKRLVTQARAVLREGDILIRYGGEEFLVVLPAAARSDVHKIGERIRHSVSEATISEGDVTLRATISIGGISWPEIDVQNEEELVRFADEAMYKAKSAGRNRMVLYEAPPSAVFPTAAASRGASEG